MKVLVCCRQGRNIFLKLVANQLKPVLKTVTGYNNKAFNFILIKCETGKDTIAQKCILQSCHQFIIIRYFFKTLESIYTYIFESTYSMIFYST